MHRLSFKKKLKAFSLFEILITLGALLLLSALVFPVTIQKLQESKLENYASALSTDIYFQQQEAFYKNSPRGVFFTSDSYTIFDGENLSTATENSIRQIPNNIQITSISFPTGQEFYFPGGEFKPSDPGYVIVTDGINSFLVYINSEGLVEYETM